MALEILHCEGIESEDRLESNLFKLSDHLQTLLPDLTDEWAVVQGEDSDGHALAPAILAIDKGVVWEVGIESPPEDGDCWRRITIAVSQTHEFGLLIDHDALTASNPDRPQRLWRALAREKLKQGQRTSQDLGRSEDLSPS